jgi:hypothetical protein
MELFDALTNFSPEAYAIGKVADVTLGKIVTNLIPETGSNSFLSEDAATVNRRYLNEHDQVGGFLPYSFIQDWTEHLLDKQVPKIDLVARSGEFSRSEGSNEWAEVSMRGWLKRKSSHSGRNSTVVRLSKVITSSDITKLHIQKAKYQDQARSNLILDYSEGESHSLRDLLSIEFSERLPPLDDARLANTLGAALVLLYEEDGMILPLVAYRAKNVAVFANTVHLPTSCAIEWREGKETTFEDLIVSDLVHEIQQEAGLELSKGDYSRPTPIALCREYLRGGKPQLFFVAATNLSKSELVRRREKKMHEMAASQADKVEFKTKSLIPRKGYWFEPKIDPTNWLKGRRSTEAACALYLVQNLLKRRANWT